MTAKEFFKTFRTTGTQIFAHYEMSLDEWFASDSSGYISTDGWYLKTAVTPCESRPDGIAVYFCPCTVEEPTVEVID